MKAKRSKPKAPDAKPEGADQRRVLSSENPKDRAFMAALPEISGAAVIDAFSIYSGQDFSAMADELNKSGEAIVKGDMSRTERMLVCQAHALEAIFVKETRRASAQEYLPQFEAHLKLALRAQNQCRMTLETLATIKNPPVVFAKQANIANNQQVNNGEAVPVARAGEIRNRPNEQSRIGHDKEQSLDGGTLQGAVASRAPLEAVAAINRPKDRQG